MTTKHTPGPWVATGLAVRSEGLQGWCGKPTVATVETCDMVDGEGTSSANATLIAAAPELLAALEALLTEADDPIHPTAGCTCPPCMARATIAKAKGQA